MKSTRKTEKGISPRIERVRALMDLGIPPIVIASTLGEPLTEVRSDIARLERRAARKKKD